MISRRDFLVMAAKALPLLGCMGGLFSGFSGRRSLSAGLIGEACAADYGPLRQAAPRARFWTSVDLAGRQCAVCHEGKDALKGSGGHIHEDHLVRCLLCAQECIIRQGERGRCRARINAGGELRTLVYGRPMTIHVDPIEKKPFYHYLPGSPAYSLATSGCPLRCKFCQNWQISQASPEDYQVAFAGPAQVVDGAASRKAPVIAFTYNEPTVFTEYLIDIAREGTNAISAPCSSRAVS